MLCRDLMKKDVAACRPEDGIIECAAKMRDRNVGFIPVVDEYRTVLGTVTDRDIAVRVVAEARNLETCRVSHVMTQQVVSCGEGDDISVAERVMCDGQKSRVLCTDNEGHLV